MEGLRVIELGAVVAASFGARLLADFGAELIKIEAPDSLDPLRYWGRARVDGRALWWPIQSRNKKLVTINLREPDGAELLVKLCEKADVLIENFRPGTLERWGVGPERLAEANPRLVIARISGFGQTGPYAERPSYAAVAEAVGGMRFINGFPDRPPLRSGLSMGDSLAGMFAVQGILAALLERTASNRGQIVDTALSEACLAMMESSLAEFDRLGEDRERAGTRLPGIAPSNVFESKDGKWLVIAANQDAMFVRLCKAMKRTDLIDDERFSDHVRRGENQDEIEQIVGSWVAEHDRDAVHRILAEADVAAGPVYAASDILADPQFQEREMIVSHETPELGEFKAQGVVPKLSRTPGSIRWTGEWEPGAHNAEVLGALLGVPDDELDALRERGII